MEVPNLVNNPVPEKPSVVFSLPIVIIIVVLAITSGFWMSRLFPGKLASNSNNNSNQNGSSESTALSTDNISTPDQLKVNKLYGDTHKTFSDTATGVVEKGSINGEGTHILNREGGISQRASLTSSTVDLDLFVGKKVEVKGQTNASNKTAWLLDVGSIKILE